MQINFTGYHTSTTRSMFIYISSNTLLMLKRFDPATLEHPTQFRKILGPYAATKLALSLWTQEVAVWDHLQNIKILSVCPGSNKTPINSGTGMPSLLIPIRNLFFPHPSKGASRLYEAVANSNTHISGIFINKGKAAPLPFQMYSRLLLDKVDRIYQEEFIGPT